MTVQELIEKLRRHDPNDEVRIAQPTHNYWHHVQANAPRSVAPDTIDADSIIVEREVPASFEGLQVIVIR